MPRRGGRACSTRWRSCLALLALAPLALPGARPGSPPTARPIRLRSAIENICSRARIHRSRAARGAGAMGPGAAALAAAARRGRSHAAGPGSRPWSAALAILNPLRPRHHRAGDRYRPTNWLRDVVRIIALERRRRAPGRDVPGSNAISGAACCAGGWRQAAGLERFARIRRYTRARQLKADRHG